MRDSGICELLHIFFTLAPKYGMALAGKNVKRGIHERQEIDA